TLLTAAAGSGIVVSETGNLELDTVTSLAGLIDLTATQSILDGNASNAANVEGLAIKLTTNAGSIGLPDAMLSIDTSIAAGSLVANAQTGISIIDEAGGMGVGTARSTNGNITLQTRDTLSANENIVIGAGGAIQAVNGSVEISSADDLFFDAAATIAAAGAVLL